MRNMTLMRALLFDGPSIPLRLVDMPIPIPSPGQVLLKVLACGICRTDLHILDGDLPAPRLPLVLGHQVVGKVVALGDGANRFAIGSRVGVPWLGRVDGTCPACLRGQENLCDHPTFTGFHVDGGFAEYAVAAEEYCFVISELYNDTAAAPLLCAGLIGYRTYRKAGSGISSLGIFGFGSAAHIVTQIAKHEGLKVFAFTRPRDVEAQEFALRHGADWAGGSDELPPVELDAALIFAPVGSLVVSALRSIRKGGVVVCGGIHMSDIPSFPYSLLWEERSICSVANLTRRDGDEFFVLAPKIPVKTEVHTFQLEQTAQAFDLLRSGDLTGAAVIDFNVPAE